MITDPVTKGDLDRLETRFRELLIAERDARQTQQTSNEKALELQAREYERRLEELNHAHKTAVEVQAKTLSREVFDQYEKNQQREVALALAELQKFKDEVNRFITAETTKSIEYAGGAARTWAVGMAILAIISNVIIRLIFPAMK